MDPQLTKAEAEAHVQEIRLKRGFADGTNVSENWNLQDLRATLKILSQELYSKQTHFLFELIQNADDNTYNVETPFLHLRLFPHRLESECNEVGFRKDQVESLCRVGASTKSKNKKGAIGEKGIGFKSVFKVAYVARIRSGPYSFQFDTRPPLHDDGMIVPTWVETLPSRHGPGDFQGTLLTLMLRPNFDIEGLESDLRHLDPAFLLFLRKVRELKFVSHLDESPTLLKEASCMRSHNVEGETAIIQWRARRSRWISTDYVFFKYTVNNMPKEEKREGISESEIMLAFPLEGGELKIEDQHTFAFLPIAELGFKFLIHADFLLTASREDIDSSPKWNRFLRDSLVSAFKQAIIQRFVRSTNPNLSFSWPQYLKALSQLPPSFLKSTAKKIIDSLSEEALLTSEMGKFKKLAELMIIPKGYRWANNDLVLDRGNLPGTALSRQYPVKARPGLRILGAKDMTFFDFVFAFRSLLDEDGGEYFRHQSQEWHSKVADILLVGIRQEYGGNTRAAYVLDLDDYSIIPLRDGTWASINSGSLFIEETGKDFAQSVPRGIESLVKIVDQEAASDRQRRKLFLLLGVKKCKKDQICDLILKAHSMSNLPKWSTEDCISHAVYLFEAAYIPKSRDQIAFASASGALVRNDTLYLDTGSSGCSISRFFPPDCTLVDRLDPRYVAQVTGRLQELWWRWLLRWPNVSDNPPIAVDGRLSPHFEYIVNNHGSKILLEFLKDNLSIYKSYFRSARNRTISDDIGSLYVSTEDGGRSCLRDTALPLLRNEARGYFPILDLEDPQNSEWDFLGIFGVLTRADLRFHIERLRSIKEKQVTWSESQMRPIYESLQNCANEDIFLLSESFEDGALTYTESHGWQKPSVCVWSSTFACSIVPVLSKAYKGCKLLFRKYLEVKSADIHTITAELLDLEPHEQGAEKVKRLLFALNRFLSNSEIPNTNMDDLMLKMMFPVWHEPTTTETRYLSAKDYFWIPDRLGLFNSFKGRIPLLGLDLSTNDLENLSEVFRVFNLKSRLLSNTVEEERVLEGDPVYDECFTKRLRSKTIYPLVARLKQQLRDMKVFCVSSVKLQRKLRKRRGKRETVYYGSEDDGRAVLRECREGLEIYVKQVDARNSQVSYVLIEGLGELCGFDDGGIKIFTLIMTTNDHMEIKEMLEAKGIQCISQDASSTQQTMAMDSGTRNESLLDKALAPMPDDIHATVQYDIRHSQSQSLEPGMEQAMISQPSPLQASGTAADAILIPSKMISNLATPPRHIKPNLSSGSLSPIALPTPTPLPRPERKLLSIQDFANSFTAEDVALTFPERPAQQDEPDTTSQVQSQSPLPFTFGGPSEEPSFRFHPDSGGNRPTSPAFMRQESAASPNTQRQRSVRQAPPQGHDTFDFSGIRDALPFTTTQSSQSPSHVASEAASVRTSSFGRTISSPVPAALSRSSQLLRPNQPSLARVSSMSDLDNLMATAGQGAQSEQDSHYEIGLYGEMSVFLFFKQYLEPHFTDDNWTSNYRSRATNNRFHDLERDYADFTFQDTNGGKMAEYLCSCGFPDAENWKQHRPTYHLEVKTTLGRRDEIFFMSNNQVNKARQYSLKMSSNALPKDIYIVIRVFDLNIEMKKGRMHLYVDPWRLYLERKLSFEARDCFAVSAAG